MTMNEQYAPIGALRLPAFVIDLRGGKSDIRRSQFKIPNPTYQP